MAVLSKVWVCGRLAEIVSLNPTEAWISPCGKRCVLTDTGLCVGIIPRPEESYRDWSF
jgi:hypothetical protein